MGIFKNNFALLFQFISLITSQNTANTPSLPPAPFQLPFFQGKFGAITDLGLIKNATTTSFDFNASNMPKQFYQSNLPERNTIGKRSSYAFSFDVDYTSFLTDEKSEKLNMFIQLSGLSKDYDLYFTQIDPRTNEPFRNGAGPLSPIINARSSTNFGIEDESIFVALEAGKYYVEVGLNPLVGLIAGDSNFKITIDTKSFNQSTKLPNDKYLANQWYLYNTGTTNLLDTIESGSKANGIKPNADIRAPEAWKLRNSAKDIIVAVHDSGVYIEHPDLKDNIWVNKGEIPGNGIDDDNNGYIDDVNGWNFTFDKKDPRARNPNPDPKLSISSHGTHVAGIIGAKANNRIGISGVAWDTQMMVINVDPLRNWLEAHEYAINNKASVINN